MSKVQLKLDYSGSKLWLIFWLILFFPVGLILLFTGGSVAKEGKRYFIGYEGSRGWLAFWAVFFFPVAVLLLFLNGVSLNAEPLAQLEQA